MFGDNIKRPPENDDGKRLKVVSIFPTLQGEGPFVGHPSVFVRLGGCNLACTFCDTDFEEFFDLSIEEIVSAVIEEAVGVPRLVVLTGGEPLRQNITALCELLLQQGFPIQIETNGTLWRDLPEEVHIVCSPKTSGGGYHKLREDVLARTQALKFIISDDMTDYRDVGDVGQEQYHVPVYVQPMDQYDDEKNKANLARALLLAETQGYRLSLQTHKFLGIL